MAWNELDDQQKHHRQHSSLGLWGMLLLSDGVFMVYETLYLRCIMLPAVWQWDARKTLISCFLMSRLRNKLMNLFLKMLKVQLWNNFERSIERLFQDFGRQRRKRCSQCNSRSPEEEATPPPVNWRLITTTTTIGNLSPAYCATTKTKQKHAKHSFIHSMVDLQILSIYIIIPIWPWQSRALARSLHHRPASFV